MDWSHAHDQLAHDLAQHLRATGNRVVWEDMQLGPAGSPRPDVYVVDKSFAHQNAVAYEVKVTEADFRADVVAGKWRSYTPLANSVYFACPAGLIKRADLPNVCGLICRGDEHWKVMKGATNQSLVLPQTLLLKLLFDGIGWEASRLLREQRGVLRNEWTLREETKRKLGERICRAIQDISSVEYEIASMKGALQRERDSHVRALSEMQEHAKKEIDSHRETSWGEVQTYIQELREELHLPYKATPLDLLRALRSARRGDLGTLQALASALKTAVGYCSSVLSEAKGDEVEGG